MIYTRPFQQRGARSEGKKVKVELNSAKNVLRPRPNDTTECIRKQNGSVVGIALSSVLFNERANTQLEKIKRAKV